MTALLILGAGTAGTTLANLLAKRPELDGAEITVVDRSDRHDYQPGYLFVPFGMMPAGRVSKDRWCFFFNCVFFFFVFVVCRSRSRFVVFLVDLFPRVL